MNKCPVEAFKLYSSKRPKSSEPCSKFYLAVNHNFEHSGNWFKNAPLGVNSLGNMLSSAAKIAGIADRKIVSHSARKTAIKRLLDGGCPASYVTQLTGHKSVNSLASYSEACDTIQRKMAQVVTENVGFASHAVAPSSSREAVPDSDGRDAPEVVPAQRTGPADAGGDDVRRGASCTVTSSRADLQNLSRGAVIGKEFHNCTFNISFNMT